MDISFAVWANGNAGTYKNGDIIGVGPFSTGVNGQPRFISFNITDLPDNTTYEFQFKRLKRMLESSYMLDYQQKDKIRLRAYRVDLRLMSAAKRQSLLETRGITLPWSEARNYLCKKVVVDNNDYSTDTNTLLRDDDL